MLLEGITATGGKVTAAWPSRVFSHGSSPVPKRPWTLFRPSPLLASPPASLFRISTRFPLRLPLRRLRPAQRRA